MTTRADYVAALRRERAYVVEAGGNPARLHDLDRELARFESKPAVQKLELAVPGDRKTRST